MPITRQTPLYPILLFELDRFEHMLGHFAAQFFLETRFVADRHHHHFRTIDHVVVNLGNILPRDGIGEVVISRLHIREFTEIMSFLKCLYNTFNGVIAIPIFITRDVNAVEC